MRAQSRNGRRQSAKYTVLVLIASTDAIMGDAGERASYFETVTVASYLEEKHAKMTPEMLAKKVNDTFCESKLYSTTCAAPAAQVSALSQPGLLRLQRGRSAAWVHKTC